MKKKMTMVLAMSLSLSTPIWAQASQGETGFLSWLKGRFSSWVGSSTPDQQSSAVRSSIDLSCDVNTGESLVQCLKNQRGLNYFLASDPYLKKQYTSDEGLQNVFSKDPDYKVLLEQINLGSMYEGSAGVREGYSVGTHTVMALAVYEAQKQAYGITSMTSPSFVKDKDRFMKYLVTYHDIGKSIAFKSDGNNSREIQFSYPIVWRLMQHSGFNEKESRLAISLVYLHKYIGDYLLGKVSLTEVRTDIRRYAIFSGVEQSDLFKMLEVLFVADAGSYPYLKEKVFMLDEQGRMIPKDQQTYQRLRAIFVKN